MNGVLKSIQKIINPTNALVTREELFNQLFSKAKQQYVIDPVEIVSRQNNPHLSQALKNSQQYLQRILSHHVDPGSLEIDQLLANLGIKSNLSSTLKYPTNQYVLEPGVYYKRQHSILRNQIRPTQESPGKIIEYIGFKDTPMMDWDVPDLYHADRNVTVRHLGDVEDRLQNYLLQNPEATIRLYQTPGGYRAFDLAHRQTPMQYDKAFELMGVDPGYRIISQQVPDVIQYEGPIALNDTERFNSRISPKPGRIDWVAQPIAEIQGTKSVIDPVNIRRVSTYHDQPIKLNFLKGEAKDQSIKKVKQNLSTASQFLQKQIENYLGL
jgi:hypothetical protein